MPIDGYLQRIQLISHIVKTAKPEAYKKLLITFLNATVSMHFSLMSTVYYLIYLGWSVVLFIMECHLLLMILVAICIVTTFSQAASTSQLLLLQYTYATSKSILFFVVVCR